MCDWVHATVPAQVTAQLAPGEVVLWSAAQQPLKVVVDKAPVFAAASGLFAVGLLIALVGWKWPDALCGTLSAFKCSFSILLSRVLAILIVPFGAILAYLGFAVLQVAATRRLSSYFLTASRLFIVPQDDPQKPAKIVGVTGQRAEVTLHGALRLLPASRQEGFALCPTAFLSGISREEAVEAENLINMCILQGIEPHA